VIEFIKRFKTPSSLGGEKTDFLISGGFNPRLVGRLTKRSRRDAQNATATMSRLVPTHSERQLTSRPQGRR